MGHDEGSFAVAGFPIFVEFGFLFGSVDFEGCFDEGFDFCGGEGCVGCNF